MSEVGHCHHSIPALRRVCILAYSLMNYHHVWREKCIGKKPLVRYRHTFYFIDTEIYTLKYYRVLSFVSLIGQTMYFHRRSPPIFELKFEKISVRMKLKHHTMESVWTILLTSCDASENSLVCCARSLVFLMLRSSWIKIVRAHFPWNNHYFLLQNSHDASGDESLHSHG